MKQVMHCVAVGVVDEREKGTVMVVHGRVKNGVIVLDEAVSLPEGARVEVVVRSQPGQAGETMSSAEHERMKELLDRIAAMPIEGSDEPFSGADHDSILYGQR